MAAGRRAARARERLPRRRPPRPSRDRLEAWTPRTPAAESDPADGDRVRGALQALSTGDRDLLLLVEVDGLGRDEAAVALGVSRALVRVRLHRARRRFAAAFAAAEPAVPPLSPIEVPRVAR
jgi:RNA polymerase sigma-70 factor (ECF subfamily)